jgi:hypothetical protein
LKNTGPNTGEYQLVLKNLRLIKIFNYILLTNVGEMTIILIVAEKKENP